MTYIGFAIYGHDALEWPLQGSTACGMEHGLYLLFFYEHEGTILTLNSLNSTLRLVAVSVPSGIIFSQALSTFLWPRVSLRTAKAGDPAISKRKTFLGLVDLPRVTSGCRH